VDGKAFDTWTRRRLNLTLSGAGLGAILGVFATASADNKKKKKDKKKKKRCVKNAGGRCTEEKPCCNGKGFECLPTLGNPSGSARCCKVGLRPCADDAECCSGGCVDSVCTCKTDGQECAGIGTLCCSLKCQVNGESSQCVP
jgi:hypothetical protein